MWYPFLFPRDIDVRALLISYHGKWRMTITLQKDPNSFFSFFFFLFFFVRSCCSVVFWNNYNYFVLLLFLFMFMLFGFFCFCLLACLVVYLSVAFCVLFVLFDLFWFVLGFFALFVCLVFFYFFFIFKYGKMKCFYNVTQVTLDFKLCGLKKYGKKVAVLS